MSGASSATRGEPGRETRPVPRRDSRSDGRAVGERRGNPIARLFGAIGLFVRQIVDEMRKVVRPTGGELVSYTVRLLVFVVVIMALFSGLDYLFHRLVLWGLAGS